MIKSSVRIKKSSTIFYSFPLAGIVILLSTLFHTTLDSLIPNRSPVSQQAVLGVSTGNTYYVSPNGSDSQNGSANAPWQSLQKATTTIASGDTVILEDGIYKLPAGSPFYFGPSGIDISHKTTYKAAPNARPIVTGTDERPVKIWLAQGNMRVEGIWFGGIWDFTDNIAPDGSGGGDSGIFIIRGPYNEVVNNTFFGYGQTGSGYDYTLYQGNRSVLTGAGTLSHGIYEAGNDNGTDGTSYTHDIIDNNIFIGKETQNPYCTSALDCASKRIPQTIVHGYGIQGWHARNNSIVTRNFVAHHMNGAVEDGTNANVNGTLYPDDSVRSKLIANNIWWENGRAGLSQAHGYMLNRHDVYVNNVGGPEGGIGATTLTARIGTTIANNYFLSGYNNDLETDATTFYFPNVDTEAQALGSSVGTIDGAISALQNSFAVGQNGVTVESIHNDMSIESNFAKLHFTISSSSPLYKSGTPWWNKSNPALAPTSNDIDNIGPTASVPSSPGDFWAAFRANGFTEYGDVPDKCVKCISAGLPVVVSAPFPTYPWPADNGILPTPTPTPFILPTPTPIILPTPTANPTPTPGQGSSTVFRVGPGFVDVIPRQIVRTNTDKTYIIVGNAQGSNKINVYWTPASGLPNSAIDFSGRTSVTDTANPISVESVYDGSQFIHIFVNDQNGVLSDFPFDTATNTFRTAKVIASNNPTVAGGYIGSSGVSGMVDKGGIIHLAYWTQGNRITYAEFTYSVSTDTLHLSSGPTILDDGLNTYRHPSLVISPFDGSLAVAWTQLGAPESGIYAKGNIIVRQRDRSGNWGAATVVNAAPAWTSNEGGADIDQGPQMVITLDGIYHLAYIEYGATYAAYGHVHSVVQNSSGSWIDSLTPFFTHDPALATKSDNSLYILGHGDSRDPNCNNSNNKICIMSQNSDGSWAQAQPLYSQLGGDNLDSSPSVKWSVVGWNRPDTIEALFFSANGGSYFNTSVWYARMGTSVPPTPTPFPTPTANPSATPTPTPGQTSTPSPSQTPTGSATPTPSINPIVSPIPTSVKLYPSFAVLDSFGGQNSLLGHDWVASTSKYDIRNNHLEPLSAGASNDNIFWNHQFGPNQGAEVTLHTINSKAVEIDLLLKSQSNTNEGAGIIEAFYKPSRKSIQVATYAQGQGWVNHGDDIPVVFGDGDQFGATVTEDGVVSVYRNGELIGNRSITSWPFYKKPGYAGLLFSGAKGTTATNFISGNFVPGDTNNDGEVNGVDYVSAVLHMGQHSDFGVFSADVNVDGVTDSKDLDIITSHIH